MMTKDCSRVCDRVLHRRAGEREVVMVVAVVSSLRRNRANSGSHQGVWAVASPPFQWCSSASPMAKKAGLKASQAGFS